MAGESLLLTLPFFLGPTDNLPFPMTSTSGNSTAFVPTDAFVRGTWDAGRSVLAMIVGEVSHRVLQA